MKLGLKIFLILCLWANLTFCRPELRATQSKLMKLKEHEKSKNVLILKKTQIEDPHHGFGHGQDGQEEREHDLSAQQPNYHPPVKNAGFNGEDPSGSPIIHGHEGGSSKEDDNETPMIIESSGGIQHVESGPIGPDSDLAARMRQSSSQDSGQGGRKVMGPYPEGLTGTDDSIEAEQNAPRGEPNAPVNLEPKAALELEPEPNAPVLYSQPIAEGPNGCIDATVIPTDMDPDFQKVLMSHRVFLLVASKSYLDKMSMTVTGTEFDPSRAEDACIRSIWEKNQRRIHGWNQRALLTCTGDFNDIMCWRVDKDKKEFGGKTHYTNIWSDGHSYIISVMCDDAGVDGWAILSNRRSIDHASLAPLMATLKNYGYDVSDRVELSFVDGHCIQSIKDDVQDGPCLTGGIVSVNADEKGAILKILESGPLYTPIQSLTNVYSTGLIIRGEQLKENEDLDSVCANYEWSPQRLEMIGFHGRKSVLDCNTDDIRTIECRPDDEASDNKKIYLYNTQYIPIWYNENSVLMYSCLSTNLKSWALFSKQQNVPRDLKRYILAKVADYDFDPLKFFEPRYDDCAEPKSSVEPEPKSPVVEPEQKSPVAVPEPVVEPKAALELEPEPNAQVLYSQPIAEGANGCIDASVIPTELDPDFQKVLMSHRVFLLVASKSYLDKMSMTVTGTEFDSSRAEDACIRSIWEKNQRRIHGWNQRALLTCTGDFNDIMCWRVDKDKKEFGGKTHYTNIWSDGHSYIISVMCDDAGVDGWAILSNRRSIDHASLAPLMATLKNYGYDVSDRIELSFVDGHCIQSIKDDVQEGPCLTGGITSVNADDKSDILKILGSGPLYTPIQSLVNVYSTGLIIRGEQLKENEDLDSVCANYEWSPQRLEMIGFHGRKSVLDCNTDDIRTIECKPDDEASDNKKIYLYNSEYIPIWYNENSVLMYSCLSTNLKSWALFSKQQNVPRDLKRYILAKVADYDFDPLKFFETRYDNCPEIRRRRRRQNK